MPSKTEPGSTKQLLQLCAGYFVSYVATGILVKYFTVYRQPRLTDMAYLFNNTVGCTLLASGFVIALGWTRLRSNRRVSWGPLSLPSEMAYIVPSGVCTAVVIPTTTLMYSLPISVLVAMVIMRGSVIVISRLVDEVQIRQGILAKRVYREENYAVFFALLAVATSVLLMPLVGLLDGWQIPASRWLGVSAEAMKGQFDFVHSAAAMTIMGLYIAAYSVRIYIMNYYKNTRGAGVPLDNKGFFAIEQLAAMVVMVLAGWLFFSAPGLFGWDDERLLAFHEAGLAPDPVAMLSGIPFGVVAFFSVFIFMFKGRTATFAGLVNRLTSLLAGTAATVLMFFVFGGKLPSAQDWISLGFILVAVSFLTRAERLRTEEMARARAA